MAGGLFPGETPGSIETKSNPCGEYNCVGWALTAKKKDNFIWPDADEQYRWPIGIPRDEQITTIEAFLVTKGFERCNSLQVEQGYLKIAIYGDGHGNLTHVARQLINKRPGWWTSKLGDGVDIEHIDPYVINNWSNGAFRFAMRVHFNGTFPDLGPLHPPPARIVSSAGVPLIP